MISLLRYFFLSLVLLPSLHASDLLTISYDGAIVAQQQRIYDDFTSSLTIHDPTGTYHFTLNANDQLIHIAYPNGVESLFSYNSDGIVCDVIHQDHTGTPFLSYHYEYNERGRKTLVEQVFNHQTTTTLYTYTSEGYLARVDYSSGDFESYTYDEWGRRLTKETQDTLVDYDYDGNLLIRAGDIYYTYDENGYLFQKLSPKGITTYTFDGPRLSQVLTETHTTSFTYDEAGRRISKSGDTTIEYLPMAPGLLGLFDRVRYPLVVSGGLHYFCYASGLLASNHPDATRYYLYNHPDGSVGAIIQDNTVSLLEFDPFGVPLTAIAPIGVNGDWYDTETGLYYLENRYYDPQIGRFISPDAFDDHPYIYCSHDPINLVDPLGLWGWGHPGTNQDMNGRCCSQAPSTSSKSPKTDPYGPNVRPHFQPPPLKPTPTFSASPKPKPLPPEPPATPNPPVFNVPPPQQSPGPAKLNQPKAPTPPEKRSVGTVARDLGSALAHEVFDGFTELMSPIPQLCDEAKQFGEKISPPAFTNQSPSPLESHHKLAESGHKKIDDFFSTNRSELYTPEVKQNRSEQFTLGMAPPPGNLSKEAVTSRLKPAVKAGRRTVALAEELVPTTQLESTRAAQKTAPNPRRNVTLTQHALQRASERNVSESAIFEALETPLKIEETRIDRLGRPSQRFIGKRAEVVLNPETHNVVSVNPTATRKLEKLIKQCPSHAD